MSRTRHYLVFFVLISILFFLFGRLFYLQVLGFDRFSAMAREQHNRVLSVEARRGTIFDRRMEPLAINLDSPSIYCDPRNVKDAERTAALLADSLDIDRNSLLERINKGRAFAWVKRKVGDETAERIARMDLAGVYFTNESERNYPNDSMAAHVIGFAGVDNEGLEGLEILFDKRLKGKPGWRYLIKDAHKKTVLFNEEESVPPQNGHNLILTIDSVIQCIAEEELHEMVQKFHASSASCVVMDPFSGRILALANVPDYNPNIFYSASPEDMKNGAISSIYEPGSIFKIVTASAALNEEKVDLDDRIYCENGEYFSGGRVLNDYHSYGELSFREVISKSSNIGTVKVAQTLGKETVYEYVRRFGFGEKTGIDLPGEVSGISRPPKAWSRSDITTIPMGQGVAVTSIQLACAMSAIANGGYLMKPYVVDSITTWEGGIYKKFSPVVRRRILEEETCEKMKDVLHQVVTSGTGKRANSELFDVCGKTGTAQMVNPSGGYYAQKYNASFIGFAPAEKAAVCIVVTARGPHPVHFGGSVAGPAFKNIAERTLQYMGAAERQR